MGKNKTVLIIDCLSICHAVKYRLIKFSHEEQKTGIIFGFLRSLHYLCKEFSPTTIVFAWDSRRYKRRDIYPPYKLKRHENKTPDEIRLSKLVKNQTKEIRLHVLKTLGYKNNYIQAGYEADDIIASVVINNPGVFKIMVTRDKDMYQSINNNCIFYDHYTGKTIDEYEFKKTWGINPDQWGLAKAIAGCSGDEVKGITNVAEKTACKSLSGVLKTTTKAYKSINDSQPMIQRNLKLVKLPFVGTKNIKIKYTDIISLKGFKEVCNKYGFESFLEPRNLQQWEIVLNMK